jgi:hypothetical protein
MQALLFLLVACNEGPTDTAPIADKGSVTFATVERAEKPNSKDLTLRARIGTPASK